MKAAVLTAAKQPFAYQTVPDPVAAPGRAVVRLKAAALNHRDLFIYFGTYAGFKVPQILGSDGAGVVEAVGDGVDPSWVGKEVILNPSLEWGPNPKAQGPSFRILGLPDDGTFAEKISISAANLAAKPAHLTWEQAAALPLAGLTAYRAVFTRAQLRAGERVLVTGTGGGAALFALQFAVAAGAEVWVTSGSPAKIARAQALGAKGGVNYRDADWVAQLLRVPGPFDVIIDSAGGEGFGKLMELAAPGGRIAFFGATQGNPPGFDLRRGFFRQINILGTTMGSPVDFAGLTQLVAAQQLVPVVDQVFPLAQATDAFKRMEAGEQFGKLVLQCG